MVGTAALLERALSRVSEHAILISPGGFVRDISATMDCPAAGVPAGRFLRRTNALIDDDAQRRVARVVGAGQLASCTVGTPSVAEIARRDRHER